MRIRPSTARFRAAAVAAEGIRHRWLLALKKPILTNGSNALFWSEEIFNTLTAVKIHESIDLGVLIRGIYIPLIIIQKRRQHLPPLVKLDLKSAPRFQNGVRACLRKLPMIIS
jgi:hypothetical protein